MSLLIFFINQTQHHRLTALTNLQSSGHYGGGIQEEREMVLAKYCISFQTQNLGTLFSTACDKLITHPLPLTSSCQCQKQ